MATAAIPRSNVQLAVLIAAIVASSMSYIDGTAVTVALPKIQAQFRATGDETQWIIDGYLLFLSAVVLIGGSLGDRYGRRLLFMLGTLAFTLASIACALTPGVAALIAARCVQGVGAALMIPQSLALITANYDADARGRTIGIWASASALTAVAGPLVGGWLTDAVSWRAIFWINVPLSAVVLTLALWRVPESYADDARGRLDVLGSASITLGVGLIVAALMETQHHGGRALAGAMLAVGSALVVAFAFIERRASAPVAPPRLFRDRTFTIATLYTFLLYAALGGALFFVPFQLESVMRYSPTATGEVLLPTMALIALGSPATGKYASRIGARFMLGAGALVATIGFALFPFAVLAATIVLGFGLATAVAPLTSLVMGEAGVDVGAASGINNSISRVGNLVAIAILGIVVAASGGGALPTAAHPQGFANAMFAAAAMSLLAAGATIFLPRKVAYATKEAWARSLKVPLE